MVSSGKVYYIAIIYSAFNLDCNPCPFFYFILYTSKVPIIGTKARRNNLLDKGYVYPSGLQGDVPFLPGSFLSHDICKDVK